LCCCSWCRLATNKNRPVHHTLDSTSLSCDHQPPAHLLHVALSCCDGCLCLCHLPQHCLVVTRYLLGLLGRLTRLCLRTLQLITWLGGGVRGRRSQRDGDQFERWGFHWGFVNMARHFCCTATRPLASCLLCIGRMVMQAKLPITTLCTDSPETHTQPMPNSMTPHSACCCMTFVLQQVLPSKGSGFPKPQTISLANRPFRPVPHAAPLHHSSGSHSLSSASSSLIATCLSARAAFSASARSLCMWRWGVGEVRGRGGRGGTQATLVRALWHTLTDDVDVSMQHASTGAMQAISACVC
jgi:hypothetical protein